MSAKQDKSQKIAFVYSNLYEIYRKGKAAASESKGVAGHGSGRSDAFQSEQAPLAGEYAPDALQSPFAVTSGRVIKSKDLREDQVHKPTQAEIRPFAPAELIGKRVQKPEVLKQAPANPAIDQLKDNLRTLNDLHARLRFMLKELEDLVK